MTKIFISMPLAGGECSSARRKHDCDDDCDHDGDDDDDGDYDDGDLYIIGAVCLSVCVSAKVIIFVFKGFGRFSCL